MIPRAPVTALDVEAQAIFVNVRDRRSWTCDDYFETLRIAAQSSFGTTFNRDGVLLLERGKGNTAELRDIVGSWRGCD